MDNNIHSLDEILDSLGLGAAAEQPRMSVAPRNEPSTQQEEVHIEIPEPEPTPLSDTDYADILQEYGFEDSRPVDLTVESTELDSSDITIQAEAMPQDAESGEEEAASEEESSSSHIPENPQSYSINETTARFSGAEWYERMASTKVTIAGVGGIGSHLAFQVSRLNPQTIFVVDSDHVEAVNMAGQLYTEDSVGELKVDAVCSLINKLSPYVSIYATSGRISRDSTVHKITMCGFDNMQARKYCFAAWKHRVDVVGPEKRKECLFLDGRLTLDTLQVFCITGDDTYNMERYEREFLFSDEEVEEAPCSMKQTTYMASMIASFMTNLFVNFVANLSEPTLPYDLPFFTQYDSVNMLFRVER